MKKQILRLTITFAAGAMAMALVMFLWPSKVAQAPMAHGNDKFTMITVPALQDSQTEAVFVLNHLTGVLTGGYFNVQNGKFSQRYLHNVGADFGVGGAREPKYAMASSFAQLRPVGGVQTALGVLHVAELSSGMVITYTFAQPTNRNVGETMPLAKLDFFQFAESVGQ